MDSQKSLACYPRRTFYPLNDNPSIQYYQVTITNFHSCLICKSCSQANLIAITHVYFILYSSPFVHLRYFLGDGRPSQTTNYTQILIEFNYILI